MGLFDNQLTGHYKLTTLLLLLLITTKINAFVVKNIKVNGLHRISVGTVLNYLPVQIDEDLDANSTAEIIRALYSTGFFQSVSLEKQDHTLIVNVVERETIGSINVIGNQEIPSDKLKELLKEMGLVKGRVFQYASLEHLKKELQQAYNARGKYNAHVEDKIVHLKDNRVAITVTISEGRVSRIKEIKFTGNHDFSNHELLSQMSLTTSNIITYFTKKDQYSKSEMDTSLESLRSFYLDRGYIKFDIVSSQVMLSPNKKDVYINIHLHEGPQYHFSGFNIIGKTIIAKEKINSLLHINADDVFSRKKITESIAAIGDALGDVGYGFPAINAESKIDEKNKTVFITFVVEPGRHVYVRRINFHGNVKTADYVLRQVIRQNEGSLLSLHNIKESERQLRVLGYLKDVNIKTSPVPETNNQVDLDVNVEEGPSAEASAQAGYGSNGLVLTVAANQKNFMGTGRSLGLGFNASDWGQDYNFSYYNPFYTNTGIGRGVSFYYQTQKPRILDVSRNSLDRLGGDLNYSMLLGEKSNFQWSYGYQDLNTTKVSTIQTQNFVNLYGNHYQYARLVGAWTRNSYDQFPYPNNGVFQKAFALAAIPVTSESLSYYTVYYRVHAYQPIIRDFTLSLAGNVSYGNQFNGNGLPYYENFYAGGLADPGRIRGYDSYSLGPRDSNGNAMGSNFLANGTAGLILPYPFSRDTIRTTAFVDAGNLFTVGLPAALSGTESGPVRYSAGVSIEWRSPFGPLELSVAKPVNKQPYDRQNIFQFGVTSGF